MYKQVKLVISEKIEHSIISEGQKLFLNVLIIGENDEVFIHRFNEKSKIFKEYVNGGEEAFIAKYTNAPFVFAYINDSWKLVDFRNSLFKGFIHSEDTMNKFADKIGLSETKKSSEGRLYGDVKKISSLFTRHRANRQGYDLSGESETFGFSMKDDSKDNEFNANLRFSWNPFEKTVGTIVEIERLKCLNGMVGMSPLLNANIPIVTDIENNLSIAKKFIGNNIRTIMKDRMDMLAVETASIYQANVVFNHANLRSLNNQEESAKQLLERVKFFSNVRYHCSNYADSIFDSKGSANMFPSHLTKLDVWNMLTEIDTYTKESSESTSKTIQQAINRIVFEESSTVSNTIRVKSDFGADHSRAFWSSDKNNGM